MLLGEFRESGSFDLLSNGMLSQDKSLVNETNIRLSLPNISVDSSDSSSGVGGEHGLELHRVADHSELFEENLNLLFSILSGIVDGFAEKHLVLTGVFHELFVEGVGPEDLHLFPVLDPSLLHRTNARIGAILLVEENFPLSQQVVFFDQGGENGLRLDFVGKPSSRGLGPIVEDDRLEFIH